MESNKKLVLIRSCAVVSLFVAGAGAALAQSNDASNSSASEPEEAAVLDTVTVTGFRQANSAAISDKREATGITDGINQDTIGLLPDLTVSDIARRIPGVTSVSSQGGSGVRSLAGAENIVIRGLSPDFNLSTFDGAPIATASENNRAANLSLFPPSIITRIEAVKTLTADLNPHGLSGQLNLKTMSAFDLSDSTTTIRASVGQNSTAGDIVDDQGDNYRLSGLHAQTFGMNDQFGLVVSASSEKFYSTTFDFRPASVSASYLFYTEDPSDNTFVNTFEDSNGFVAPVQPQLFLFENEQERASAAAKLEWQPDTRTYASLFAGLFYQDEQETRHEHLVLADRSQRPDNQTQNTGDWALGKIEAGFVYQPEETTTTAITGKLDHEFDDDNALHLTGSFSSAEVDVIRNMSKFFPPYSELTSFSYDISSGNPVVSFVDAEASNDPSTSSIGYIRERTQKIQQDLTYLDASFEHNFEAQDRGLGYQIGAAFTGRDHSFDREYIEGDVFDTANCSEAEVTDCPLVTFDQFIEDVTFPTTDPDVFFYLIDDAALRSAWAAQGKPITNDRTDNSINSDYMIDEQILAFYMQATYKTDRFQVQGGLRYDATEVDVNLFVRDQSLPSDPDSAQYVAATRNYEYDFLLPSLIATYNATDQLLLRGGYSRTIGRPNFAFLKRGESFGIPNLDDPSNPTISVSIGNTDLKPLVSDNFDLSAEYYFDNGGSLISVTGFYKDVADLIYIRTTEVPDYEFDGDLYQATVTQPLNATDSTVYGVEFAVRKDFAGTLPAPFDGFVFDGNITWIGSEFTYINAEGDERDPGGWLNQPELLANAQLSYEYGPFGAKVAYSWVDEYLSNILADQGDLYDMYSMPRGVIDLQARYDISESVTLLAEVQNLTEEGLEFNRRFPVGDYLGVGADRGRVAWLGVNVNF
ncbi:MAG: TonB-dependent receptor [Henriciella sp.]